MITEKRKTGNLGEELACKYLKKNGYKIITRNYVSGRNETDIICRNKQYIVFTEVKTRKGDTAIFGTPSDAVNRAKIANLRACASAYLFGNKTELTPRFDVIEVILSDDDRHTINHIENAF